HINLRTIGDLPGLSDALDRERAHRRNYYNIIHGAANRGPLKRAHPGRLYPNRVSHDPRRLEPKASAAIATYESTAVLIRHTPRGSETHARSGRAAHHKHSSTDVSSGDFLT